MSVIIAALTDIELNAAIEDVEAEMVKLTTKKLDTNTSFQLASSRAYLIALNMQKRKRETAGPTPHNVVSFSTYKALRDKRDAKTSPTDPRAA